MRFRPIFSDDLLRLLLPTFERSPYGTLDVGIGRRPPHQGCTPVDTSLIGPMSVGSGGRFLCAAAVIAVARGPTPRSAIGIPGDAPRRAINSSSSWRLPSPARCRSGHRVAGRRSERQDVPECCEPVLVGIEHLNALGTVMAHDPQLRRRGLDDRRDQDAGEVLERFDRVDAVPSATSIPGTSTAPVRRMNAQNIIRRCTCNTITKRRPFASVAGLLM